MKAIVIFFILFIVNGQSSFSIDNLLDYLQQTGYYEIIQNVKRYFGDDVAIELCQELVQTNQCETVVRIYMTNDPPDITHPKAPLNFDAIMHELEKWSSKQFQEDIRKLLDMVPFKVGQLILMILRYFFILIEKLTEDEILKIIKSIISKTKIRIILDNLKF